MRLLERVDIVILEEVQAFELQDLLFREAAVVEG